MHPRALRSNRREGLLSLSDKLSATGVRAGADSPLWHLRQHGPTITGVRVAPAAVLAMSVRDPDYRFVTGVAGEVTRCLNPWAG